MMLAPFTERLMPRRVRRRRDYFERRAERIGLRRCHRQLNRRIWLTSSTAALRGVPWRHDLWQAVFRADAPMRVAAAGVAVHKRLWL